MSGAIRTMTTNAMAGQMTTGARRACGRSSSGTNHTNVTAYVWSTGNTPRVAAFAIAPIPVFADTKLHARRPKEASQ
jgi:hypothetical protein